MIAVADPGFRGGPNLLFYIFFVEKCIKNEKRTESGGRGCKSSASPKSGLSFISNGKNDDYIRGLPNMRKKAGII